MEEKKTRKPLDGATKFFIVCVIFAALYYGLQYYASGQWRKPEPRQLTPQQIVSDCNASFAESGAVDYSLAYSNEQFYLFCERDGTLGIVTRARTGSAPDQAKWAVFRDEFMQFYASVRQGLDDNGYRDAALEGIWLNNQDETKGLLHVEDGQITFDGSQK